METRGITVKVPIDLHNAVRKKLEETGMTMSEYIAQAIENDLYGKDDSNMGEQRTMAFQMPIETFQRLKAYLKRNNITQKKFVLDLIEKALEEDEAKYNIPQPDSDLTPPSTGNEDRCHEDGTDEEAADDDGSRTPLESAGESPQEEDSTGEDEQEEPADMDNLPE